MKRLISLDKSRREERMASDSFTQPNFTLNSDTHV